MAGSSIPTSWRLSPTWCAAGVLIVIVLATIASLPWTLSIVDEGTSIARFEATDPQRALLPPATGSVLGTDRLGRDLLARLLLGGGISLMVGLAAAGTALVLGTSWGLVAAMAGGKVDSVMMRMVDILYGLPAMLLVVLLAVAVDGARQRAGWSPGSGGRLWLDLMTLWVAIGTVSWLTLARVVRGQVLSLRQQPFLESARVVGVSVPRQVRRYYLPWLAGPIIACTALIVPMAMLSEAFLSFLGIGVREPLPSWGNLAASGLSELNPVKSHWWLLLWPCLMIGITLMSLMVLGESIRTKLDPRQRSVVT